MSKFERILEKYISLFIRAIHIDVSRENISNLIQFVKFGIVGVTNSAVGYWINILAIMFLKPYKVPWDYVAGNVLSFIISVLWSFYWNNKFVFKLVENEKRNLWTALLKTYASYAFTGLVLNNVLSFVWIELLGISKMIAPLINMVIGLPINYILNKLWAFKSNF